MGKKNWIEFDNQENIHKEKPKEENFKKISKINISKQKKGKKGKTITLIKGLSIRNEIEVKELLKKNESVLWYWRNCNRRRYSITRRYGKQIN